jgi:hypothetical protein
MRPFSGGTGVSPVCNARQWTKLRLVVDVAKEVWCHA